MVLTPEVSEVSTGLVLVERGGLPGAWRVEEGIFWRGHGRALSACLWIEAALEPMIAFVGRSQHGPLHCFDCVLRHVNLCCCFVSRSSRLRVD